MTTVLPSEVCQAGDPLPLGAHRLLVCKAIHLRRIAEGHTAAVHAEGARATLEQEVKRHLGYCRRAYGKSFDADVAWYLSRSAADGLLTEYDGDVAAAIRAMPYDAGRLDHNSDPVLSNR